MGIFFGWILLSFVGGMVGSGRKIGFWGGFLVSLLLSPLVGIIVALSSKSVSTDNAEKELVKQSQEQTKALGAIQQNTYISELHKLKELYDSGLISMRSEERRVGKQGKSSWYGSC